MKDVVWGCKGSYENTELIIKGRALLKLEISDTISYTVASTLHEVFDPDLLRPRQSI